VSSLSRRVARLVSREALDGGVLEAPAPRPPRTPLNRPLSQHRRFAFASLSLSDVKRVKNHLDLTVNDVVVAMCTGALRAWLLAHDSLPDRPLVAQIPVSVRTSEEVGTFGNRVSIMGVPLPTDEPDPLERVQRIHTTMLAAKNRHRAVPASLLQDAARFIPPALFARASRVTLGLTARGSLAPTFNVVISNVPGPREPLYMGGATLLANYPVSVIVDGIGLNITVLSYLDSVGFGLIGCREIVPNIDDIAAAIPDALAELVKAAQNR
jgi:WS/DGAT/MGAT family acyltransferase